MKFSSPCLITSLACIIHLVVGASTTMTVGMHAPWGCTPLFLEAVEFIGNEIGERAFWKVVDDAADHGPFASEAEAFDWISNKTRTLSGGGTLRALHSDLASRELSPVVEMHAATAAEILHARRMTRADRGAVSTDEPFAVVQNPRSSESSTIVYHPSQLDEAVRAAGMDDAVGGESVEPITPLRSEHVRKLCSDQVHVYLFAQIDALTFSSWHSILTGLSDGCKVQYRLRHHFHRCGARVDLDGFAVSVHIKRTDYVVVDNLEFSTQLYPWSDGVTPSAAQPDPVVTDPERTIRDLDEGDLPCVGPALVARARKFGLGHLVYLLENFPATAAATLPKKRCSDADAAALRTKLDGTGVAGMRPVAVVNGFKVDHHSFRNIAKCSKCIGAFEDAMVAAKLKKSPIHYLRGHPKASADNLRLDLSAVSAFFLNDVEHDEMYEKYQSDWRKWAKSADSGAGRFDFRGNFVNVVAVAVASAFDQYHFLQLYQAVVSQGMPLRCGVLLVPANDSDEISQRIIGVARHIDEKQGGLAAFRFLAQISYERDTSDAALQSILSNLGARTRESVDTIVAKSAQYVAAALALKENLGAELREPMLTVNGIEVKSQESLMPLVDAEVERLRKAVLENPRETSSQKLVDFSVQKVSRRNPAVVDMALERISVAKLFLNSESREAQKQIKYMELSPTRMKPVTVWLCASADSAEGLRVIELFLHRLFAEKQDLTTSELRVATLAASSETVVERILSRLPETASLQRQQREQLVAVLTSGSNLSTEACGNTATDAQVVANGRRIRSTAFSSVEDVDILVQAELSGISDNILSEMRQDKSISSDQALLVANAQPHLTQACGQPYGFPVDLQKGTSLREFLWQESPPSPSSMEIFVFADVMDPALGKWARHVLAAKQMFAASVTMLLIPTIIEAGQVNQYTYSQPVVAMSVEFDATGSRSAPVRAVFSDLPQDKVLTVSVQPPGPWLIESYAAAMDMDNVILANVPDPETHLHAQYVLDALLVDGSCVDESTGQPGQGVKLELHRKSRGPDDLGGILDTMVMQNLGYFQFKVAQPGVWQLSISPGKSSDAFELASVGDLRKRGESPSSAKAALGVASAAVEIRGLHGRSIAVMLKRKTGMESERVSEEGSSKGKPEEKINVFSVASGHLYERFLKIMMLSSLKHASVPVKYWLLKNHLSPGFKAMLPLFAERYGFEYELVTYKWPHWLREQTEKQRTIWGYKILFLDVLFPLKLSRVVFVDSDQVVRSDLFELFKMDLEGAPYGYTPFCDSREEVEGYRFWKQGFWSTHLNGRPYHISALYVVDLDRFRYLSAGDTLRVTYQQLSGDPNSLSNLDQDLPNFASVPGGLPAVPIFSLPKEWLWCESWCDDASKAAAKTIDLCNNPMTKEPKLKSAVRIVEEWTGLDEEATKFTEEAYQKIAAHKSDESCSARSEPTHSTTEVPGAGTDEHDEL